MTFRKADWTDRTLLHQWRLQDENGGWYQPEPTSATEHADWYRERLNNPLVKILIWEEHGDACGMCRRDSNDELAFSATSDDVAERMLAEVIAQADQAGGRLKATVDQGDPKAQLLERAGFTVHPATFLTYKP